MDSKAWSIERPSQPRPIIVHALTFAIEDDGHLVLSEQGPTRVAAFPPGEWSSIVVVDED